MPRVWEAMKDVVSCEKLGGTAHEYWSLDIRMGQPGMLKTYHSSIYVGKPTRRTETSKYPEEKKITNDSPSSGERTGKSPNRKSVLFRGCRTASANNKKRKCLGRHTKESDSLVRVRMLGSAVSWVGRDQRNPVWICGYHPVRLNTPYRPIVNQYRKGKVKSTVNNGVK